MERSDGNDILGTYFRPRRAAELIHQNKMLNHWKDNKRPDLSLGNWMGTSTLANSVMSPSSKTAWQTMPGSAAMKSVRNGNTSSRDTFDDLKNKPFYGVRPSLNVQPNNNSFATDTNFNKSLNYPNCFNGTGDRLLSSMRNPFRTTTTFARDNYG